MSNFSAISWRKQVTFQQDDIHFVLDQHAKLHLYSASSLKKQYTGRHIVSLGTHYPVFEPTILRSFSLLPCALRKSNQISNSIVFCLTQSWIKPTINHTQEGHANHYTTGAVQYWKEPPNIQSCVN